MSGVPLTRGKLPFPSQVAIILVILALAGVGILLASNSGRGGAPSVDAKAKLANERGVFRPSDAQWASLITEPVRGAVFRASYLTEGKIAVNEEQATPIYSPYAGRVLKLLAKPGDRVISGQPLFIIEATDAVQVHNDFISSITSLNKAQAQLKLAQTVERRLGALYESKAIALKDWQQAQADLINAQNDVGASEAALEAARNRLRILGRSDGEIARFQQQRTITPETPIVSPIDGTVVLRKVGPGQYIATGSSDPVFMIGDLSTVWLTAFVRESDASKVEVGQAISFTVLTYPDRVFEARINFVTTAFDPNSRRLLVRATIDNSEGLLRPEMFANVTLLGGEARTSPAVPREAIIHEGDAARVWVARNDQAIELRQIKLGLANGKLVEVLDGLKPGEKVVTRGGLFIDRMAGDQS